MSIFPKLKFRNFTSPSKSHAISKNGIVATSHPLASQLGIDMLKDEIGETVNVLKICQLLTELGPQFLLACSELFLPPAIMETT